jgi:hypothetical protein
VLEAVKHERVRAAEFAAELGLGVADLQPEDLGYDALTLTWGLSAWMRRCSVGIDEAWDGVAMLRSALLEASGLDRASEPVPLRAGEPSVALVNVAAYLDALVERAARQTGKERRAVVSEAVALLQA